MQKYKCDFTGVESDWVVDGLMPTGWQRMYISSFGTYRQIQLVACKEVVDKFNEKMKGKHTPEAKPTLAEMIEQAICDIAHDAAQDAVAER